LSRAFCGAALSIDAGQLRGLIPALEADGLLPPPPPAEKTTARKDQARQACT